MSSRNPMLLVFAGPNGSGKSTVSAKYSLIGKYVNADEIQQYLRCTPLEAAQIAEATREKLLAEKQNFTFETVLSTDRNLNLMRRAKDAGYSVACVYVLTYDAAINVERVRNRVINGGHDVPTDKIISRYQKALALIPKLFSVCDELYIYDNSADRSTGSPQLIVKFNGESSEAYVTERWTVNMIRQLLEGTYFCSTLQ